MLYNTLSAAKVLRTIIAILMLVFATACSSNSANPIINNGDDTTPPETPSNLSFLSVGNGEIHLGWDANNEPDLTGYRLYRTVDEDNLFNYDVIYDSTGTTFNDIGLEYSTRYFYRIAAYDDAGNESSLSNAIQGMPQNTQPPLSPANLNVIANNIGAPFFRLFWDDNSESDLFGYKIYRSTTFFGSYTLLDSTTTTFFDDFNVSTDVIYYYTITAYDKGSEESVQTQPVSDIALSPPVLIRPINTELTSATPTFKWLHVMNAERYKVFLLTTSQAGEIWAQSMEASRDSILYDGTHELETGKIYYWKIATITKDSVGLNSVSATQSFRVQ